MTTIKIAHNKTVDLAELDQMLGGHGLNSDGEFITPCAGSPVTQADLKAAYDSYDSDAIKNREMKQARQTAFANEADPIFFAWQRGETTEEDWLNKVAEIRAKYPYAE